MLKPVVQPKGGEPLAPSASAAAPGHVATPGGSAVNPSAPDQQGERALRRDRRDPVSGRSRRAVRVGAAASMAAAGAPGPPAPRPELRFRGGSWEAGPRAGAVRVRGARGTHQLQRAEADERAASGTAAHGAGGVRAARAARDPRLPAAPPPDSGAAPYGRSTARPRLARPAAAARRSRVWTRAPPLLVSRAGRGQYGAQEPSVWPGSPPPTVRVRFLGRGSRAGGAGGGREATDGE